MVFLTVMNRAALVGVLSVFVIALAHADAPKLRMYLKDGSFVDGKLNASPREGHLGFLSELFDGPLEFDVRGVRSVAGNFVPEDLKSGHAFLLEGGTRITGELKTWDDKALVVQSKSLGDVMIDRRLLRGVEAVADSGKRVYSGPKSIDDWTILDDTDKWTFAAGSLKSPDNEAKVGGKVELPEKFRLSLSMSWEGRADFVMSLGCSEPKKPAPQPEDNNNRVRRAMVQPTQNVAAVRLEMWDAQLAVVREVGNLADIAVLPLDDESSQFDLTFFVDQVEGLVAVYSPRGKLLEKIQVAEEKGKTNAYAMLENHGKSVSLDRFDVYEWDGHLPDSTEYPDSYVLDKDEKIVNAEVVGFDANKGKLLLVDGEGENSEMALEDVRRVILAEATVEVESKEDGEAEDDEEAEVEVDDEESRFESLELDESRLIEVDFVDTSRIVGYLANDDKKGFGFKANGIADVAMCTVDQIVAVSGSAERFAANDLAGARGTLTTDIARLQGVLVDNGKPDGDAVLVWQPWASETSAAISRDFTGSIVYSTRKPMKPIDNTSATPAVPMQQRQPNNGLGALIGGIFGNGGVQPRAVEKKPKEDGDGKPKLPTFEIVFRSGDTVDGVVESVDQRGVTFKSDETSTTFVPHEQMDSITLGKATTKPSFDETELKRLLTVPRNQKSDPPTHLFVSTTGDYLRGRLVGVTPEVVGAEVRLEVQEIPRDKVARVIWLHDRPWLDAEKAAKEKDGPGKDIPGQGGEEVAADDSKVAEKADTRFLVHAVRPDTRGVTFSPEKVVDGTLSGTSELLGDCSIRLDAIHSLLFGRDVGEKALALRKESWKLELATLPKAYLDTEDDAGAAAATSSPLVGRNAPEIKLQTINDVEFVLSENRDKVIVLDFWASWCGPCIATMPKVDAIVDEFDPRDVELVAVNLQDSVERARIALKRMEIEPTVVMDVDGEAARFYDARAIPQTVIVDREGKITHLFVGGGSKFLEQFSAALKEVVAKK
ncbi:MAG: TlpA disulfide reductase family protein [Pirellulaceae bacterium]